VPPALRVDGNNRSFALLIPGETLSVWAVQCVAWEWPTIWTALGFVRFQALNICREHCDSSDTGTLDERSGLRIEASCLSGVS
jgi:hypothetical protein